MTDGRPIVIDTDPGQDDAVAILAALASPELDLIGITVVAGNVPVDLTAANARRIVELGGRPELRVFSGCPRPLMRPHIGAEGVHGKSGLGGADLPEPMRPPEQQHAVPWLIETLLGAPGLVTLCMLGPMTNLAVAIVMEPAILPKIGEIAAMGGSCLAGGNITPAAEFNIFADPHAAAIVFGCGRPLTLMPLDVTHQVLATPSRLAAFAGTGSHAGRVIARMLEHAARTERRGRAGRPLHDACVIAYLLRPDLFRGREVAVAVETVSETMLGATVADWWGVTGRPPNCRVMTEADADGVFALLAERLARLPAETGRSA